MPVREPSKLEMQVLAVLWSRGPSTVREVLEDLSDGKDRAYTTVLTILQVMEKKGLVSHTSQGNSHVYSAKVSQRQAVGPVLRGLVSRIFGGSPAAAMQHLLAENDVSKDELEKIKELISEHEKGAKAPRNSRRNS